MGHTKHRHRQQYHDSQRERGEGVDRGGQWGGKQGQKETLLGAMVSQANVTPINLI